MRNGVLSWIIDLRSYNCLRRARIHTVLDALRLIKADRGGWFKDIRNMGSKTAKDIDDKLVELGFLQPLE